MLKFTSCGPVKMFRVRQQLFFFTVYTSTCRSHLDILEEGILGEEEDTAAGSLVEEEEEDTDRHRTDREEGKGAHREADTAPDNAGTDPEALHPVDTVVPAGLAVR